MYINNIKMYLDSENKPFSSVRGANSRTIKGCNVRYPSGESGYYLKITLKWSPLPAPCIMTMFS